jgi:Fe-S-cluster-containing dehydrogenase component/CRP-like cAMP-binding protein
MPRAITDQDAILAAVGRLDIIAELLEEKDGKKKYGTDLEVIVQGRDYGNGKKVGPYVRLLVYAPGETIMRQGEWGGNTFYLAVDGSLDVYITGDEGAQQKISQLVPGTCFGEMSVLAGVARNATIIVPPGGDATVLEITRPALRLLRKLPRFGQAIDTTYRTHGFGHVLEEVRQATGDVFTPELLAKLGAAAEFKVYGKHHVLCQEGKPVDKVILIKNGWVRRVRGISFDPETSGVAMGSGGGIGVDFLGAGNCLGLEGIKSASTWEFSASLMARSEVLEISIPKLATEPSLQEKIARTFADFSSVDEGGPLAVDSLSDLRVVAATEEEIATGIVDGANLLVMDMDRCVRCGNCSLACHKVHGQSRLLRRGIHIERPVKPGSNASQHVLSPQVCMHCKDPECLTGCPTGAIFRDPHGQVDIDPHTCIGCFDCATQCPYDAISMVPREIPAAPPTGFMSKLKQAFRLSSMPAAAPFGEADDMVAIKCNLCEATPLNPEGASRKAYSCEENCPTGALVRVNPHEYFSEIDRTLGIVFRDETHAVGRNIHRRDRFGQWLSTTCVIVMTLALLEGLRLGRNGFDAVLFGSWLNFRWLTGIVGFLSIIVVMTYPLRKQIYRRRAGALRYWMMVHIFIGLAGTIILLMHSGRHTGSLLTTALYVSFIAVILSGLFGGASYIIAPRILTSIEGNPLLIEDLIARREELRESLKGICGKADERLRGQIERKIIPRFHSRMFALRQLISRQDLKALLAAARGAISDDTAQVAEKERRALLMDAVETTVTLSRLDALIMLHHTLRIWIPPHVISTALMIALMLTHIAQVVFFKVR